ncbi:DUF2306 domain-containing protein [Noviherbaspirillum sp.]|uniref:DUF2306 domain-containing protein n=1 Tax=Noviherbaspirillum sp. TaxID=1926288 RepID=UPI002FE02AD2
MSPSINPVIHTLADAPAVIYVHLAAALTAVMIGSLVLVRRKGTASHKVMGRIWLASMLMAAVSSFAIQARGSLSWIHGFAILVFVAAPVGWHFAKVRNIRAHRITMVAMFVSLCMTGLFTLLPYRMLGQAVFGTEAQRPGPSSSAERTAPIRQPPVADHVQR